MQYLLVENKETIHLGPVFWRQRFIQSELDDQEIVFKVPPIAPEGDYLSINDTFEIFPVVSETMPENYDPRYHDLVGPNYTYVDNQAFSSYSMVDRSLDSVKNNLKQTTMFLRYIKEIAGTKTTIQGQEVSVDTARGTRDVFVQQFLLMPNDGSTVWKFPEAWLTLTKADLGACVAAGVAWVQSAFDWEAAHVLSIEAATTMAELAALELVINPPVVNNMPVPGV